MKRIASLILGVVISIGGLTTSVYADTKDSLVDTNITLNDLESRTAYDWTNSYTLRPFGPSIVTGPVSGGKFQIKNGWGGYDSQITVSVSKVMDFRVRIDVEGGSSYYKTVYGGTSASITLPKTNSYYKVYIENYTPNTVTVDVTVRAREY